jgi:hypothetical protein
VTADYLLGFVSGAAVALAAALVLDWLAWRCAWKGIKP